MSSQVQFLSLHAFRIVMSKGPLLSMCIGLQAVHNGCEGQYNLGLPSTKQMLHGICRLGPSDAA